MVKKKTKRPKIPSSYLLKKDDKFYLVPASVVSDLTPEEAFRLGLAAQLEQKKQLLEDAIKGDHYINNIKVVDGLEQSLQKLKELFPFIKQQISAAIAGGKIGKA